MFRCLHSSLRVDMDCQCCHRDVAEGDLVVTETKTRGVGLLSGKDFSVLTGRSDPVTTPTFPDPFCVAYGYQPGFYATEKGLSSAYPADAGAVEMFAQMPHSRSSLTDEGFVPGTDITYSLPGVIGLVGSIKQETKQDISSSATKLSHVASFEAGATAFEPFNDGRVPTVLISPMPNNSDPTTALSMQFTRLRPTSF